MSKVFKYLILLVTSCIFGTIICISLFHMPLFVSIHVLMYKGILLIIVSAIILSLILIVIHKKLVYDRIKLGKSKDVFFESKDILSIIIVFISINMMFFTLVPVTVERSLSVFVLSKFEQKENNTMTKDEVEKIFLDKYVVENDAFGKRLDEQIVTGSVKQNSDGSYTLTEFGHFLVNAFKFIGNIYNVDMKNMKGTSNK